MTINFNELQNAKSFRAAKDQLVAIRKQILATESNEGLDQRDQRTMRVFPHKDSGPLFDERHVLARGIDVFVGCLALLPEHDSPPSRSSQSDSSRTTDDEKPKQLELLLQIFQQFLVEVNQLPSPMDADSMRKALHSVGRLNAEMTTLCGVTWKALSFAREVEYKKAFGNDGIVTKLSLGQQQIVVSPITYNTKDLNELYAFDEKKGEQPWKRRLKKMGLESYVNQNLLNLQKGQTPQMQGVPAPIAAYHSTYTDAAKQKPIKFSLTSTGITEPYDIQRSRLLERFRLDPYIKQVVLKRHQILFGSDDRLSQFAGDYLERHPNTENRKEITVPILHQTLIVDTLPFSPDSNKTPHAIRYKTAANRELRKNLKKYNYYWINGELTKYIKTNGKTRPPIAPDAIKVNFLLLETNNCVNRHHKYSKVRNHDMADARTLITLARNRLNATQKKGTHQSQNLRIIVEFLNSSNYSLLTPYKYRGTKVKEALKALGECKDQIGLLAAAAVELKCTVHETWLGAARRYLHNALPAIPGLRWIGVGVSLVLANAVKLVTAPALLARWAKHHNTRRKTLAKSNYEQLVATMLGGQVIGSCMSGVDRLQETWLRSVALLQGYEETGHLVGYNDDPKEVKALLTKYAPSLMRHKRNFANLQTGLPANSEGETNAWFGQAGLLQEHLPAAQQGPKGAATLRKLPKKIAPPNSKLSGNPNLLFSKNSGGRTTQLPSFDFPSPSSRTPSKP